MSKISLSSRRLTYNDLIDNIHEALSEIDDAQSLADLHNHICSAKVKVVDDNLVDDRWEYVH